MTQLPRHKHIHISYEFFGYDKHEFHFENPVSAEALRKAGIRTAYEGDISALVVKEHRRTHAIPLRSIHYDEFPVVEEKIQLYNVWNEDPSIPQPNHTYKKSIYEGSTVLTIQEQSEEMPFEGMLPDHLLN